MFIGKLGVRSDRNLFVKFGRSAVDYDKWILVEGPFYEYLLAQYRERPRRTIEVFSKPEPLSVEDVKPPDVIPEITSKMKVYVFEHIPLIMEDNGTRKDGFYQYRPDKGGIPNVDSIYIGGNDGKNQNSVLW